jgi:hypothetical protein
MDKKKGWGSLLLAVGFVVALAMASADWTGLGGHPGFGPQQIFGILVGVGVLVVGVVLVMRNLGE